MVTLSPVGLAAAPVANQAAFLATFKERLCRCVCATSTNQPFATVTYRNETPVLNGTTVFVPTLPEQIKSVTNQNPTDNADIRFSLSKPVEETKDLVALHNLNADKLKSILELGGFPMPSIAITKDTASHEGYGDISVILKPNAINPESNSDNKVYSADAYTPTFPATAMISGLL